MLLLRGMGAQRQQRRYRLGTDMKSIVMTAACAGLAMILSIVSSQANCLDDIKKAGVLTAGTGVMGSKPWVWQNEDGTYSGFEWEILHEIGKRIGIPKQEFVVTEWSSLIPGLKAARWDLILSGMIVTQERMQGAGISFSDPYFMLYDYIILPDNSKIKTMADLHGKILASHLGTLDSMNAHALVDEGHAGSVLDFNASPEAFAALRNGQADAVILDEGTLHAQQEMLHDVHSMGEPIHFHPKPEWVEAEKNAPYVFGSTAVGVRKECPELLQAVNGAIQGMNADGARKAILTKFGLWADYQDKLMK